MMSSYGKSFIHTHMKYSKREMVLEYNLASIINFPLTELNILPEYEFPVFNIVSCYLSRRRTMKLQYH